MSREHRETFEIKMPFMASGQGTRVKVNGKNITKNIKRLEFTADVDDITKLTLYMVGSAKIKGEAEVIKCCASCGQELSEEKEKISTILKEIRQHVLNVKSCFSEDEPHETTQLIELDLALHKLSCIT